VGGASGTLINCTIVGNSATNTTGGASGTLKNCILYSNDFNDYDASSGTTLTNCCVEQLPANGLGNITNPPLFVDINGGNLRLQSNSPCINGGNNVYAPGSTDLDGNPRIVGGTIDIGAYECQSPALLDYYAWLQGYGLPTDASAVYNDSDSDGLNNYQEWRCDTNPTNALSVLQLLLPATAGPDIAVRWLGVTTRSYYLQRASDLATSVPFSTIATNISGVSGANTFIDPGAATNSPFFYRIGVQ
jgi:hypothetical protein